ncbi:MAG: inositol 2-dehydrogenase [Candidatus Sericytochromatia bacterium]|nr:inositol 2-dehydrogenase [Candidatus Tanganyikabacteria bacterium]
MPGKVRLGLIGAGRIGRVHAHNIAFRCPDADLVVVADTDPEAARSCAEACGAGGWTTNYHQVLEDPAVHAVVIASPTDTHARIIEEAAREAKDILCEKPIDLSLARVDEALAMVARSGVRLQIAFNRRFDPSFRRARDMVAAGKIGAPHLLRLTSRDPSLPSREYLAAAGGLFTDMTIHDFDMARWLLGEEVVGVWAQGAALVDPTLVELGDIDAAVISLRFASGALGCIDNHRGSAYGYDVRAEVHGSEGAVVVGNLAPTTLVHYRRDGLLADPPLHWFIERFEQAYVEELREFVRCLREDRAPSPDGADGRAPLLLAAAANRSLRERREVPVSEIEASVS